MVKMSPCHGVRSGFDSRNLRQKKIVRWQNWIDVAPSVGSGERNTYRFDPCPDYKRPHDWQTYPTVMVCEPDLKASRLWGRLHRLGKDSSLWIERVRGFN